MKRNSVVIYKDWVDALNDCTDEQKLEVLNAVFSYAFEDEIPELSPIAKMAFSIFKRQIDRDRESFEETCKKRAEAGRLGGFKKASNRKQMLANVANGSKDSKSQQSLANVANLANLAENENENENDFNIKKINQKKFCFKTAVMALGVDEDTLSDWLEVRRKAKASNTETAFKKLRTQIEKAAEYGFTAQQCIETAAANSWRGFEAEWMQKVSPARVATEGEATPEQKRSYEIDRQNNERRIQQQEQREREALEPGKLEELKAKAFHGDVQACIMLGFDSFKDYQYSRFYKEQLAKALF